MHSLATKWRITIRKSVITVKGNAKSEQTPLFLASLNGHFAIAKCLIAKGANINKKNLIVGWEWTRRDVDVFFYINQVPKFISPRLCLLVSKQTNKTF